VFKAEADFASDCINNERDRLEVAPAGSEPQEPRSEPSIPGNAKPVTAT
jgi:hypothetical protein